MTEPAIRKAVPGFHWEGVETLPYKDPGSAPFRDVTRQVLFRDEALECEWRYFEISPDGHSTLERHAHAHAVMILRGRGCCLVGGQVHAIAAHDLVSIPPMTWHQFRADAASPLGFLCMVNRDRDRPQLPGASDLAALRRTPAIAAFIRVAHG